MPRLTPVPVSPKAAAEIDEAIAKAVAMNRTNMDRVIADAAQAAKTLQADLDAVKDVALRRSLLLLK